jgi:hypothetical protein
MVSGGLNPYVDIETRDVAERMYKEIRNRKTDYINVARNTGFSVEQTKIVKNYLFYDRHLIGNEFTQFSASYEIAQSWRRLSERTPNNIEDHDVLLLQHELYEIGMLVSNNQCSQSYAHMKAEAMYNYSKASRDFYLKNIYKI